MAKDEVTRQIEEMQKYLKEQEELNKPVIVNTDETIPVDKESAEKVIEPEIVRGLANINEQSGSKNNQKGCGCGCFSFIIFIIFVAWIVNTFFKMLGF